MKLVTYFKALDDETRLRLLNLLMGHELNVNEIVSLMKMGQSRISRHLKILTDAGLLSSRRDGLSVFYTASQNGRGSEVIQALKPFIIDDRDLSSDIIQMEVLLSRNAEEKTRYFDSIAPEWDAITTDLIGGLDISREIVRRISSCADAADLGCGTGALLGRLRTKALRVIGVDQSANMLMAARNRYANDSQGIDLRIGSIEHLPMRDREVETAVMNMVLHYLPSPAGGINEASRVLRKGGLLIVVDFEKHGDESLRSRHGHRWLGFTKIEIDGWLKSAGFSKIACTHYPINNGLTINLFNTTKQ